MNLIDIVGNIIISWYMKIFVLLIMVISIIVSGKIKNAIYKIAVPIYTIYIIFNIIVLFDFMNSIKFLSQQCSPELRWEAMYKSESQIILNSVFEMIIGLFYVIILSGANYFRTYKRKEN